MSEEIKVEVDYFTLAFPELAETILMLDDLELKPKDGQERV